MERIMFATTCDSPELIVVEHLNGLSWLPFVWLKRKTINRNSYNNNNQLWWQQKHKQIQLSAAVGAVIAIALYTCECLFVWVSVYLQLLSNCKVERQNNKQQMQKPVNGVKWKTLSIFKFWIACSQFSFSRKLSSCFWQHGPMDWKFFESEIKPTAKFSCEYVLFIRASIKLWHSDYPIAYHLSWFFLSPSIHNAHVFALPQQFWAISKKQVVCQNCVNN